MFQHQNRSAATPALSSATMIRGMEMDVCSNTLGCPSSLEIWALFCWVFNPPSAIPSCFSASEYGCYPLLRYCRRRHHWPCADRSICGMCNAVLSTMEHIAVTIRCISFCPKPTPFSGTLDQSQGFSPIAVCDGQRLLQQLRGLYCERGRCPRGNAVSD